MIICRHWWFYSASAHWPEALPYIDLTLVFFCCLILFIYVCRLFSSLCRCCLWRHAAKNTGRIKTRTHSQTERKWFQSWCMFEKRKKMALIQLHLQFNLISLITYRYNVQYEIESEGDVMFRLSLCNSDMMVVWMQLVREWVDSRRHCCHQGQYKNIQSWARSCLCVGGWGHGLFLFFFSHTFHTLELNLKRQDELSLLLNGCWLLPAHSSCFFLLFFFPKKPNSALTTCLLMWLPLSVMVLLHLVV